MNVLLFWSRITFGFIWAFGGFAEIKEGRILSALSVWGTSVMLVLPSILLARSGRKPSPLRSLKYNFDMYTVAAWLRAVVGFMCAAGGMSYIGTEDEAIAPGLLIVGLFLLSPLNGRVFSYRHQYAGSSRWRPWGIGPTVLFLLRSVGLILFLGGMLNLNEPGQLWEYIMLMSMGLVLILSRQIRLLFVRKEVSMYYAGYDYSASAVPAADIEALMESTEPSPHTQATTSQPVPVVLPAVGDLARLSAMYKTLQPLEPGKKIIAYREFLNELFARYNFSAKNVFYVDGESINGSFELDGQFYILTARCKSIQSGYDALLMFNAQVEAKSTWARGIFISDAGFVQEDLATFAQGKRTSIIGLAGSDLQLVLAGGVSLVDAIKLKARRAVETNRAFVPLHELI